MTSLSRSFHRIASFDRDSCLPYTHIPVFPLLALLFPSKVPQLIFRRVLIPPQTSKNESDKNKDDTLSHAMIFGEEIVTAKTVDHMMWAVV